MPKKKDACDYSKTAMFTNPPASATDRTGYAVTIPDTEDQAQNLKMLCNVPVSSVKDFKKGKK